MKNFLLSLIVLAISSAADAETYTCTKAPGASDFQIEITEKAIKFEGENYILTFSDLHAERGYGEDRIYQNEDLSSHLSIRVEERLLENGDGLISWVYDDRRDDRSIWYSCHL